MLMRCCLLLCLGLLVNSTRAQPAFNIRDGFRKIELKDYIRYWVDSAGNRSFEQVKQDFKGIRIAKGYPNFGDSPYPHWLRFELINQDSRPQKVSLITKGIDSLQTILTVGDSLVHEFPKNGAHISIYEREQLSPYLSQTFNLKPGVRYAVWVRIRNVHYRLATSPFDLYAYADGNEFLFRKHFLYSLFAGGMFIIVLFSLTLVLLFKEKLYFYYLCCVSCALAIMFFYNDFTYLFTDRLSDSIINKNIFGILSSLVPVFYLLFAEQFLQVDPVRMAKLITISRVIMGVQFAALLIFISTGQPLFENRAIFYGCMAGLSSITLIHLYHSLRQRFFPARLFLLATLPVTITVILEAFTNLHQIPVQEIHDYYYLTTLSEMVLLTLGIGYRFKMDQDERYKLQRELIYVELKTQKEERNRIADNLHNEVGSLLWASRLQVTALRETFGQTPPDDHWQQIYTRLDEASTKVRDLSHELYQSVDDSDVASMLRQKYQGIDQVDIYQDGLGNRLNKDVELIIYNVVSEIITNAIKHASCTLINVQLIQDDKLLTVIVEDDGIGFDTTKDNTTGYGLRNIKHRVVNTLKGTFRIDSKPGRGTVVILKIPI